MNFKRHYRCPMCNRRLRRAGSFFPSHQNNFGKQCRTSDQPIEEIWKVWGKQ